MHVMLVHFPVALWPAQWALHAGSRWLPVGTEAAAYWLLAAGGAIGWLAMITGALDWVELARAGDSRKLRDASRHALLNGTVLAGFSIEAVREGLSYPAITVGPGPQAAEAGLLVVLAIGNYFGGAVVWRGRNETASKASADDPAQ